VIGRRPDQLMFAYEPDEAGMSDALKAAHKRSRQTLTKYVVEMVGAGLLVDDPAVLAHGPVRANAPPDMR